jgi:hypothetical protein
MNSPLSFMRRAAMPTAAFTAAWVLHFGWLWFFPERDPAQSLWADVSPATRVSTLHAYIESQSYWLGFSYAASLAFAVAALRRYRERRLCAARRLAIGGVSLTGGLAVAGCWLLGCCGSPMLAVYASLFGSAFLPLAKPLLAVLTLASLVLGWLWLLRQERRLAASNSDSAGSNSSCGCGEAGIPSR